jgi:membrane peptidoglycan carboxypeptidase
MASVYATLAAGGIYSKPMAITKVVLPNGKIDTDAGWGQPKRERVVTDWVAATVTKVLGENMLYGTGRGAHVYNHTDAGKTGTTENYADAWFCGYTPYLEATVWIGYPRGEIPMLSVHGITVSGPTFPAQIWHDFMTTAIGPRADVPFPAPRTPPVWTAWHGQWQYSGSYGYSTTTTPSGGSAQTTTSGASPTQAATTAQAHTTPATTAAPPAPVTTAPPAPPPTDTAATPTP